MRVEEVLQAGGPALAHADDLVGVGGAAVEGPGGSAARASTSAWPPLHAVRSNLDPFLLTHAPGAQTSVRCVGEPAVALCPVSRPRAAMTAPAAATTSAATTTVAASATIIFRPVTIRVL
ncbi:hypothetical protein GCM10020219_045550 [Nonomuraea dietziae]